MPAHMAATMEGLNKIKEESIDLVRFGPSSLLFVYPVLVFFTNQSVDLVYAQLSFSFGSFGLQTSRWRRFLSGSNAAAKVSLPRKPMRVPPCLAPTN